MNNIFLISFLPPEEVVTMPSFNTKASCAQFLLTKKAQGFISDKSWMLIQEDWRRCSQLDDYINLAKAVYVKIAEANGLLNPFRNM